MIAQLLLAGAIAAPASVWKLAPLETGLCFLGEDHVLGEGYSPEKRLPFAIYSFLAEGPNGDIVLIDLGPKTLDYANAMFRRYGLFREKDGERLCPDDIVQKHGNVFAHLARRGIGVDRVKHIVFTHLHADHHGIDDAKDGGAAEDFPNAILHVSKKGWEENLRK
ncbi:MAG: MBL fold metallo-hydrolase, partial [Planctomycetes bacterium]|nr:MBL fold metallo-hydrolase [Planctomycetota bacterium]